MALIEGFRIQNYRSLRDIAMGRIGTDHLLRDAQPLTPLTCGYREKWCWQEFHF